MNISLMKQLAKIFRDTADNLDAGNTELDEDQAINIAMMLTHKPLSKDQACTFLNISRSKFDSLVNQNKLPKGRKRRGFKELVWFQDELNNYIK